MTHLLILLLFNSLFCFGFAFATGYDEVLGCIRRLLYSLRNEKNGSKRDKILNFLFKPFMDCEQCMSSIWGSIFYWLYIGYQLNATNLLIWPVYCISLCGLNRIISRWV